MGTPIGAWGGLDPRKVSTRPDLRHQEGYIQEKYLKGTDHLSVVFHYLKKYYWWLFDRSV